MLKKKYCLCQRLFGLGYNLEFLLTSNYLLTTGFRGLFCFIFRLSLQLDHTKVLGHIPRKEMCTSV